MPQKFFFTTNFPDSLGIDSNHSVTAERFLRFWEAVEKDGERMLGEKGPFTDRSNLVKGIEIYAQRRTFWERQITHGLSFERQNFGRYLCGCGEVHETVGPIFAFDQKEAEDILTIVSQAKSLEEVSAEDKKYVDGTMIFEKFIHGSIAESPGLKSVQSKSKIRIGQYCAFNKTTRCSYIYVAPKLFSRAKDYFWISNDCGKDSIVTFEKNRGVVTKFTADAADLTKSIGEKKQNGPSDFHLWRYHNYCILTYLLAERRINYELADEGWVELTDNERWVETEGHTRLQVYDEIERRLKEELEKPPPWTL